jgi:GTP cyclohydrolase IA
MIEAEHMCISSLGVEKAGAATVTTHLIGSFRDNPSGQVCFMTLLK